MKRRLRTCAAARSRQCDRAFTLIELLVVIAIIALLVSILLPALSEARRAARQALNVSNERNLSSASVNYGGDFRDVIPSFTWRAGEVHQLTTGLAPGGGFVTQSVNLGSDLLAAAHQALDIIRRRAQPENFGLDTSRNDWIPHPTYSHLVLMDFLSARMPEPMLLNPNDKFRQDMADTLRTTTNPTQYCMALPNTNAGIRSTWPYSSSYQFAPASYMPDKEGYDGGFLRQADDQIYYFYNGGSAGRYRLGGRKITEVQFPAQKVFLMEDVGRLNSKREYPLFHPNAAITIATFDGQVRVLKMQDCNPGGYARPNGILQIIALTYTPRTQWGYPLWPDGSVVPQNLHGYCRWTYRGLRGIDFGGAEPTSAPF